MLILASKSPRRLELLKYITEDFKVMSADVDETLPEGMSPSEAVLYLSEIKARPFASKDDIVIGADTVVAIDGKILGKPLDTADSRRMLRLLSGREHSVFTGVTILKGDYTDSFFVETKVRFFELTDGEIDKYIETGETLDKAGAYGIQSYGALFVESIKGDYFNVVGLPVSAVNKHLSTIASFV